jgi:hypothetical protein
MKKIILLGLLVLSLPSCKFLDILMPGTEVSRVESGSISPGAATALVLDFPAKLTIISTAGSDIIYSITKKVQAASVVEGDKALDGMAFKKSQSGSEQSISMSSPKIDAWYIYGVSVEGTIQIPASITILRCSASSGNLEIDGGGISFVKMDLRTTSGQLDVRNFSLMSNGVFSGIVESGNLNVNAGNVGKNSAFTFSDQSGSADINVSSLDGSTVTGTVASGSLHFNNSTLYAPTTITLSVTSGSLDVNTGDFSGTGSLISLNDTSGGINFSTSLNNHVSFDLKTTSGSIYAEPKYGAPGPDNVMNFSRNGGGNTVRIRCTSGGIHLD